MKEQETEAEILGKLNIEKGKAEALKEELKFLESFDNLAEFINRNTGRHIYLGEEFAPRIKKLKEQLGIKQTQEVEKK